MQEWQVVNMVYSWRFGPDICRFMRHTCIEYGPGTNGIYSPLEFPENFFVEELQRVPDTELRFTTYFGAEMLC